MKTATVTFHAAHNYGSMLHSYALQQIILSLNIENKIINFRSQNQKSIYTKSGIPKDSPFLKRLIYGVIPKVYKKQLYKKYELFENFLKDYLLLTEEYSSLEDLSEDKLNFDCYISGGDQIWKPQCKDFSWIYYLNFVIKGKRISYAVSMGPGGTDMGRYKQRIAKELQCFRHIGVRERGTSNFVKQLIDIKPYINIDPVFLLNKEKWIELISKSPLVSEDYIFIYTPTSSREVYKVAKLAGYAMKIKVVTSQMQLNSLDYFSINRKLDIGPLEFLNLIYNAKLVVSGSFHALAFCLLLHKPFVGVNAMSDNRMRDLLIQFGMEKNSVNTKNITECIETALNTDFSMVDDYFQSKRRENIMWLKNAIYD